MSHYFAEWTALHDAEGPCRGMVRICAAEADEG